MSVDTDAYRKFTNDLNTFCKGRGFSIRGTCDSEGIYGELWVCKNGDDPGWREWGDEPVDYVRWQGIDNYSYKPEG